MFAPLPADWPWSVMSGFAGIAIGFLASRVGEVLNQRRERKRAKTHLLAEIRNVQRHYSYSLNETKQVAEQPQWLREVRLNMCRFYGNGLGSFEFSNLRLFKAATAERILDFMLTIRNNDFFIDRAVLESRDTLSEDFEKIVSALRGRMEGSLNDCRLLRPLIERI